jgi:hypothetical protein
VSADARTEHYDAYFHPDGVAVFDRQTGDRVLHLTPELARELQSVADRWRDAVGSRDTGPAGKPDRMTVLLTGGPSDSEQRMFDLPPTGQRPRQIEVMPVIRGLDLTAPLDITLPQPARYARTGIVLADGVEIYRYEPGPLS